MEFSSAAVFGIKMDEDFISMGGWGNGVIRWSFSGHSVVINRYPIVDSVVIQLLFDGHWWSLVVDLVVIRLSFDCHSMVIRWSLVVDLVVIRLLFDCQ